ncbi:hypothetical protein QGN32_10720 [Mycolicibacterium sp. ND9-15]|uniref:hypothetical protein n=1 Tax=Mycolicibacterium sp. ND9-15 TaxID=3042320 RepID=UPI002DDAEFC1|nr:hypothetical protein [Mycolicibacterium sp. ND9-15]WSE58276.1 hypothetical protein QGN32_10720 [Mycolicibacterium sp. ND9-15]
MVEREASGDFDYLFDDIVDVADTAGSGAGPDVGYFDLEQVPGRDMSFDAFDENTWYFEPAPPPWYRTRHTLGLLVVAAVAAVAIVVSGVLLIFRTPGQPADDKPTPVSQTAQTQAPRTESPSNESPPPPPRPPVATPAPAAAPPPAATYRPRSLAPRTARDPEIGVTRTPVTRSPISVAPQRPVQSR